MNLLIRDRSAYEHLNPLDVARYLTSVGWKEIEHQPDRLSVWSSNHGSDALEVLLPLRRTLGDFVLRMVDVVNSIAAIENRSPVEVLNDLQTSGSDVVRVRIRQAGSSDGSISLDHGEALVENARELMLASACAVISPKAYYAYRRPEEAMQFVRNLRLGQSERGSYVLAIYSPVTPLIQKQLSFADDEADDPFERRAVVKLATALNSLKHTLDRTLTNPDAALFEKLIPQGVSANLCSALVGMNGDSVLPNDELQIGFSFARSRPTDLAIPRSVVIPADHFGLIQEAARFFKKSAPPEEVEIRGFVVQLRSEDVANPVSGPVIVKGYVDGVSRRVQITLDTQEHQQAAMAYRDRLEVSCRGELTKQGNSWVLTHPRQFTAIQDE